MAYEAQIYGAAFGIGKGSKSLSGRRPRTNPIQLYSLSKRVIMQGAPTWAFLKVDPRQWGVTVPLRYSQVTSGYSYTWVLSNNTFVVTDDKGVTMIYQDATTIKSLGISWAVLKSTQFYSDFTNFTGSDIFLLCSRPDRQRLSAGNFAGIPALNDYLAAIGQHAGFSYLSLCNSYTGETPIGSDDPTVPPIIIVPPEIPHHYESDEWLRTILLSKAENLQATNIFDPDLLNTDIIRECPRDKAPKNTLFQENTSLLMIALFSSLILKGSKPVFEPWMLWKAYEWYSGVTHGTANPRQIFDLSPRWG